MTDSTDPVPAEIRRNQAEEAIRVDLQHCHDRLGDLEIAREAVIGDVGDLLRQARQLGADIEDGGSAQPVRSRPHSPLSNREVARLHAGYGYGGHEEIDTEFWRRYPVLHTWHWITFRIREISVPDDDPLRMFGDLSDPLPPEVVAVRETLRAEYRARVDAIAYDQHWPVGPDTDRSEARD